MTQNIAYQLSDNLDGDDVKRAYFANVQSSISLGNICWVACFPP